MSLSIIDLGKDEEIIAIIRKSILLEVTRFIFGIIWIFLPFFFLFPLLKLGLVGIVFLSIIFVTGILYFVRVWNMWRLSVLVITDQRIVDIHQLGIFKKEIHEFRCTKIKSVKTKKIGVVGLFNLGAIRIHSKKSQKFDIEFYGVRNPSHVRELILEVKYLVRDEKRGHAASQDRVGIPSSVYAASQDILKTSSKKAKKIVSSKKLIKEDEEATIQKSE